MRALVFCKKAVYDATRKQQLISLPPLTAMFFHMHATASAHHACMHDTDAYTKLLDPSFNPDVHDEATV